LTKSGSYITENTMPAHYKDQTAKVI